LPNYLSESQWILIVKISKWLNGGQDWKVCILKGTFNFWNFTFGKQKFFNLRGWDEEVKVSASVFWLRRPRQRHILFIGVGRTKTVRIDWLECDWGEIGNDQQITRLSTNL